MLDKLEFGARQNLANKEIQMDRRDVLGRVLVHCADIAGAEKFQTRRNVFHVGGGEDGDAIDLQQAPNAAQESRRGFPDVR